MPCLGVSMRATLMSVPGEGANSLDTCYAASHYTLPGVTEPN